MTEGRSRRQEGEPAISRRHEVYDAFRRGIGRGKTFAFHLNIEQRLLERGKAPPVMVHFTYMIQHSPRKMEKGTNTLQLANLMKAKKLLEAINHDAQALKPIGVSAHLNPESTVLGIQLKSFRERRKRLKLREKIDAARMRIAEAVEKARRK